MKKKTYKIDVDCANCANLMEDAARKTEGVAEATVNFMLQKMIIKFEENYDGTGDATSRQGLQKSRTGL